MISCLPGSITYSVLGIVASPFVIGLLLLDQILQNFLQALEAFVPEVPVFPHPLGRPFRPSASSRHGRHWAFRLCRTSPARCSTFRCLEMPGRLRSNGLASSVTEASPCARRARIARRVGSARAANVTLN